MSSVGGQKKGRDCLHNHVKDASQKGESSVCVLENKAVEQALDESVYNGRTDYGVKLSCG